MKDVLLFGATGLIGSHLLRELLALPDGPRVTAVTRRPLPVRHARLVNLVSDMTRLEGQDWPSSADVAFCCLGTTLREAGGRDGFYAVDHDLVLRCAAWSRRIGVRHFLAVSAMGAAARSPVFYNRVKAEAEHDLAALGFPQLTLMQPSLLLGERGGTPRVGEAIAIRLAPVFSPLMVGPLSPYSPVSAADVARAMLRRAQRPSGASVERLRWRDFRALCDQP